MQILIIDGDKRSRELAARYLSESGHQVEVTGDVATAKRLLTQSVPNVLIADIASPGGRLVDLLKWVRNLGSDTRPYIIASFAKPGFPVEVKSALELGADDFIRKPWVPQELVFRAETVPRLAEILGTADSAKHMDWSSDKSVVDLNCWLTLEQVLAKDIAEILGFDLASKPLQQGLMHSQHAAEIPMTMTQNQAQVQIGVGLSLASANQITTMMFDMPDPPGEMIQDLLREFANTSGGAFKRAAEHDNVDITTGLPSDVTPADFNSQESADQKHFVLYNEEHQVQIFVEVELRSKGLQKITVKDLKEGMVLSKDLLNSNGMLLVRSGTRLTSSNVERLTRLVDDHVMVEVAA